MSLDSLNSIISKFNNMKSSASNISKSSTKLSNSEIEFINEIKTKLFELTKKKYNDALNDPDKKDEYKYLKKIYDRINGINNLNDLYNEIQGLMNYYNKANSYEKDVIDIIKNIYEFLVNKYNIGKRLIIKKPDNNIYNDAYISVYTTEKYMSALRNQNELRKMINCFKSRYNGSEVNGMTIFGLESLNHFVVKMISTNPNFINSPEFKNYKKVMEESIIFGRGLIYSNIFFSAFPDDFYKRIFDYKTYQLLQERIDKKKNNISLIESKLDNNYDLSQKELDYICDVLSFDRNINNTLHEKVIKYIFNNLTKSNSPLRCNGYVLDAICSYFPKIYPKNDIFNPMDFRMVADGSKGRVRVGRANYSQKCMLLERNLFENINFKSTKDINNTYLKRGNDFTFMLIVMFHEFEHLNQKTLSKQMKFSDEGYMYIKHSILNKELNDYKINHDSDDIEIDATEKGWRNCERFYTEHILDENLKEMLSKKCYKNIAGTQNRRLTNMKKSQYNPYISRTYDYDIKHLNSILRTNKLYLSEYPMLMSFYDGNGQMTFDFIKNISLCNTNTGCSYVTYALKNLSFSLLEYLKSLNSYQLNNALSSIQLAFNNKSREILDFDYNTINSIHGEYDKVYSDDKLLEINYQDLTKIYLNIMKLFNDQTILNRSSQAKVIKQYIENRMKECNVKYQNYINSTVSQDIKK
ncbi:MAG: hypothetical protein ACI33S_02955 [Bacilli bacterium]